MNEIDVIGLGTIVVDHQVVLSQMPEPDTKCDALWDRIQVGGPVPTALAALSQWGHRCSFIGSWSNDWHGQIIEDDFEQVGIDSSASVRVHGGRTGVAQVWVDQSAGTRTICCLRSEPVQQLMNDAARAALRHSRLLHVDGWPAKCSVEAVRFMRESGGQVAIDTGSLKPATAEILGMANLVNCPMRFLTQMFESTEVQSARAILEMGAEAVTVTDGSHGAWLMTQAGTWHQPAIGVEAVDSTGAGDVFSGAMIHGWLDNLPPQDLLRFACTAAGLKCEEFGNREALPTLEAIQHRMEIEEGQ